MYKYTEMVLNYDLQSLKFTAHHNMAALLHTKPALTQDIQWHLWCSGQQWKIRPVEVCFY